MSRYDRRFPADPETAADHTHRRAVIRLFLLGKKAVNRQRWIPLIADNLSRCRQASNQSELITSIDQLIDIKPHTTRRSNGRETLGGNIGTGEMP